MRMGYLFFWGSKMSRMKMIMLLILLATAIWLIGFGIGQVFAQDATSGPINEISQELQDILDAQSADSSAKETRLQKARDRLRANLATLQDTALTIQDEMLIDLAILTLHE